MKGPTHAAGSPMRDLKQGVAYVWTRRGLRAAMWIRSSPI